MSFKVFVLCFALCLVMVTINFVAVRQLTNKKAFHNYVDAVTKSVQVRHDNVTTLRQKQSIGAGNLVLSKKKIVIIVAYMRTGSSLTGSTLQEYPGTFYLFEPIRWLSKIFIAGINDTVEIAYPNGSKRLYSTSEKDDVTLDEIKNWITCKLERLSVYALMDSFHISKNEKIMQKLKECVPYKWGNCFQKIKEKCREAPLHVLKLIRLSISLAKQLLPLFPNLKIIHLNRDPRGIYNSRSNLKKGSEHITPSQINAYCKRWIGDIRLADEISREHTDRIMTVKYEDIAETPHAVFQNISTFIGVPYCKEMKHYVTSMTSASHDGCEFCQERKNSTLTASEWRRQLKFTTAKFIYKTCESGNKIMGYLPFYNSDDMHNLKLPSNS